MDESPAGGERALVLKKALTLNDPGDAVRLSQLIEHDESRRVRDEVTDVLFVVHGIRDEGYWAEKIANRVLMLARGQPKRVFAVETASYGYFPMLSFLRPGARQEKVEWLMDQYTTARARYPKAGFSFVGHSHGTYLLAKALKDYPAVRFNNVVLAGSVVRRDFEWSKYMPDRVRVAFNFVTTSDWVVAFFPNALQQMQVQDLGSAGHDGFVDGLRARWLPAPGKYVVGGHSAALDEAWWNTIATLVVDGEFELPPGMQLADDHFWLVKYPAMAAPLLWVGIALTLALVLRWILRRRIREWQKTLALVAYLAVIWLVLTQA
jgi:hypothetical protein